MHKSYQNVQFDTSDITVEKSATTTSQFFSIVFLINSTIFTKLNSKVGRNVLYALNCNVPKNSPAELLHIFCSLFLVALLCTCYVFI